jgi:hypothetical protein
VFVGISRTSRSTKRLSALHDARVGLKTGVSGSQVARHPSTQVDLVNHCQ